MGMNLRYSPLEWKSKDKIFDFGGYNIEGLIASVLTTTGDIRYVDNGASNAVDHGEAGKSSKTPWNTMDYANGQMTANNGDVVVVMPGHNESVVAAGGLDLDTAGVTWLFLGDGTSRAKVTFSTATSADMDIDAANITMIRPKFVAGIDALTGPIDVNATDFTIIDGEWHDAASIETTDCIIATSGATRLKIDGWKFFKSDEAGTQKESHIQLNGVDDAVLKRLHIEGDFDTGIIENVTDECLRITLEDMTLKNTDPGNGPCMVLDSACSGWARNVHLRNANGTVVDDNSDINWGADCLGFSTDGAGGEPIGTADSSSLEGKIDTLDSALDSDVSVLIENLSNIRSDIIGLNGALDSDVTRIRSDLAVIEAQLDSDVSVLIENLSNLRSDVLGLNGALDSDVTRIRSDLAVIEAQLDSDVSVLVEHISNIRSDLAIIESETNDLERCVSNTVVFTSGNQSDVFTVSGGPVEVTQLQIVVTTTCSSNANKIAWMADPTQGSDTDITLTGASEASGLDMNGVAAGTIVQADLDGTVAVAFASGTSLPTKPGTTMVIPVGGIDLDVNNSSMSSGAGTAYLRYKPLSKSSLVTGG